MENTVLEIDKIIRQNLFFDFYVLKYDGNSLIIAGSNDLSYYHTLEIIFEDVYFVSAFFNGWHSNTTSKVFYIPENINELNRNYGIEKGYQIFILKPEDHDSDIIIAAKRISF